MSRNDDHRVADILDAADELAVIVAMGPSDDDDGRIRLRAVERLLEIIGEATRALSDEFIGEYPGVPWSDISALRILLAHHYHRIDPNQVWAIARVSVPDLVITLRSKSS